MKKVIVGLSGGVDSSIAALLLKKQGYEVIGLFMKNWIDDKVILDKSCPWLEDSKDAMLVAQQLEIPFHIIDLSKIYYERIVKYMFSEYEKGRTPNPDILCNREIKFDLFLQKALELGADFIATGHYARKEKLKDKKDTQIYRLLKAVDPLKDQTYFLAQLSQYQLSKALFPIGEFTKSQIRKMALEANLVTAKKKDSQGLCFVGKIHLPDFLKQQLKTKEGPIIEIPKDFIYKNPWNSKLSKEENLKNLASKSIYGKNDGEIIGNHQGAYYFTKGQRKGLKIGGKKEGLFVLDIDTKENRIYVGMGKNHPGLYKKALFIRERDIHWIRKDLSLQNSGEEKKVQARIRYRQTLERVTLHKVKSGLYIEFENPQFSITSGQFATWYEGEELIGSGVID